MKWKTEQATEKIKDSTEWFFEKINNIDEHLDRLIDPTAPWKAQLQLLT